MSVLSKPTTISNLPPELLTEIWARVKFHPQSLGRLVQVSHAWHDSATSIPSLWVTPYITERTDIDVLRTFLARAKNAGLSICIDFHTAADSLWLDPTIQPPPHSYASRFLEIMTALTPSSHNWLRLEIFGPHYLGSLLKTILVVSLAVPRLSHVSIILDAPPQTLAVLPPTDSIFENNQSIVDVETIGYPVLWETFPFQTLTALTLGCFTHGNTVHWNTFAQAISNSQTLRTIAFSGALPPTFLQSGDDLLPITLPFTTSLSLAYLTGPDVQHLLNFLLVPQLVSLTLALTDAEADFLPILQHIPRSFPHLQGLAIDSFSLDGEAAKESPVLFFTQFSTLMDLRLNFHPSHGVSQFFWDALIRHAGDPNFHPALTSIMLIDVPLYSAQELILRRNQADRHIPTVTLHCTGEFVTHPWPAASTTWLTDNTTHLFLTQGLRKPWARGSGSLGVE
ncbi:hypothetical protein B0H11DRAFT_1928860 [Mycena galericulata]|nr:hypothetical protein B0H11DRAFT_1928860 [Mycena galericulata]